MVVGMAGFVGFLLDASEVSLTAGHGQSQIQCKSESVARQSGQRAFLTLGCGSEVWRA